MQRLIDQIFACATALGFAVIVLCSPVWAQATNNSLTSEEYILLVQSIDYTQHLVTKEEFIKRRENGAIVLDLRRVEDYNYSHIEGALHLGSANITQERLAELVADKDQPILIYCTNSFMMTRRLALTDIALPQFVALGYKNVFMVIHGSLDEQSLPMTGE